ncbi:hypothetical protein IJ818_02295 [bacterium]|nr:hypothetical protein [bacterium]
MVSSFQSSVNDSTSTSTNITDPILAAKKREEAKQAKLKAEQDARAKSLFIKLQEQREVYADAKKAFYKAKSNNQHCKNRANMYQSSAYLRTRNQERYEEATLAMEDARGVRNTELRRLESYTASYCSAQTIATNISIFMG